MRLFRLLFVIAIVTVLGGMFGALIGSLVGFAAPAHLMVGAHRQWNHPNGQLPPDDEPARVWEDSQLPTAPHGRARVEMGFEANSITVGLALGAAWGLVLGGIGGLILGGIDQILLFIRFLLEKRNRAATAAPVGTPGASR